MAKKTKLDDWVVQDARKKAAEMSHMPDSIKAIMAKKKPKPQVTGLTLEKIIKSKEYFEKLEKQGKTL